MGFVARARRWLAFVVPCILLPQAWPVSAATDPLFRIPRAAEIRLRYADEVGPAASARAARIYDEVRGELLAQGYEPRVIIGILSHAAAGGLSAFVDPRKVVDADVSLARPSIAEELCDAGRLASLGLRLVLELGRPRTRMDVAIQGEPVTLQNIVGGFPGRMTGFYEIARDRTGNCAGRPFRRASAPAWRVPVRIAATGNAEVDAAVRAALARLRSEVPGLPIDDASFGAAPGTANFWLGDPAVPLRTVFFDGLGGCIERGLCRLSEIAGARGGRNRSIPGGAALRALYLSRPYDDGSGRSTALIEVDRGERIVGAACGSSDYGLGQAPAPAGGRAFHPEFVILCLAQGLGAVPGALTDAVREVRDATLQDEISQSFRQLRQLYRSR